MKDKRYIQVGVTALRDPATGDYLPAVPLYVKSSEASKVGTLRLSEAMKFIFADKIRQYTNGCKEAGISLWPDI